MPTLNQINVAQNNGQIVLVQETNPVIEPLAGPVNIDKLMDRFPEQVYTRSKDSHLYRFLMAFCGETGMGRLRRAALLARLKNEAGLLNFNDIDSFYGSVLDFKRLKREIYTYDPASQALEKEVWDKIHSQDNSYRKRVVQYLQSTRYGNAPRGIELAAESAAGIDVEVIENYRALFDRLTPDPLGIQLVGNTDLYEEFVIIPQAIENRYNVSQDLTLRFTGTVTGGSVTLLYADVPALIQYGDSAETVRSSILAAYGEFLRAYEIIVDSNGNVIIVDEAVSPQFFSQEHVGVEKVSDTEYVITINDPNVNIYNFTVESDLTGTNAEAVLDFPINENFYIAKFSGPNPRYINAIRRVPPLPITDDIAPWKAGNVILIEPEIERNIVKVVDKVRPVHTVMTVKAQPQTNIKVATNRVQASSERVNINRFVTGKSDIDWPTPGDPDHGTFIYGKYVVDDEGQQSIISVEREATTLAYGARAVPVIYHTIDAVAAYTNLATGHPDYNTERFFGGSDPIYQRFRSLTFAPYGVYMQQRFPSLMSLIDEDDTFFEYYALAKPNTPFILGG